MQNKRENVNSPTTETFSSHSDPPNSEVEDLKLQVRLITTVVSQ